VKVPTRPIFIGPKEIQQLTVFSDLLKEMLNLKSDTGRTRMLDRVYIQNSLNIGLSEDEKIFFRFDDNLYLQTENFYDVDYNFYLPYFDYKDFQRNDQLTFIELYKKYFDIFEVFNRRYFLTNGKIVKDLASFFAKLNKAIDNKYESLNEDIIKIVHFHLEKRNYKYFEKLEIILEQKNFKEFVQFIDINDFNENGNLVYYSFVKLYYTMEQFKSVTTIYGETEAERKIRIETIENDFLWIDYEIRNMIQNVPEKYIIDLSKI